MENENKSKNRNVGFKIFIFSMVICIFNILLFIYQIINKKIAIWNIGPTLILIFIIASNIKNSLNANVKNGRVAPSKFAAKNPKDDFNPKDPNEDFCIFGITYPKKQSRTSIIIKIIFIAIFIGLTILFNALYSNKTYDQIVTGHVISTKISYQSSSDGSTMSKLFMEVSYEVNNEVHTAKVVDSFSTERPNTNIKLCVNNDGKIVCVYDNLISYKIMFYTCLISIFLIVLSLLLKIPAAVVVMNFLIFLGIGLIALFNSYNWSFWMLKDFTVFGALFSSLGLATYINLILSKIIGTHIKRKLVE